MFENAIIRVTGNVTLQQEVRMLDMMGEDGWEFVQVRTYSNKRDYYFRRKLPA